MRKHIHNAKNNATSNSLGELGAMGDIISMLTASRNNGTMPQSVASDESTTKNSTPTTSEPLPLSRVAIKYANLIAEHDATVRRLTHKDE